ncbi:MAG: ammonia-forming cytochrome c nitrite reductase subunit c552 [Propionibacteriaceae bacterium]|jgi:nitrite reductase (cytochrome c-552)|nr:ammonia-forming cytochrome c nitrite reductase subunit c552 [Propionibacteriaceae bacterium]
MSEEKTRTIRPWLLVVVAVVAAGVTFAITWMITSISDRKAEEKVSPNLVVALTENDTDPAIWGQNYPIEYESYLKTSEFTDDGHAKQVMKTPSTVADDPETKDVNEGDPREWVTSSKLQEDPRLVTLWSGYAFAKDYGHLRGHAYMLIDQRETLRVRVVNQPGACLNCHATMPEVYNELGNGDMMAGFAAVNKMPYSDATTHASGPIACIDCHDPATMELRITRPALITGLQALKASQGIADFDVNRDATHEEMRTYVCAQCHVEYYFSSPDPNDKANTLTFPWKYGNDIDDTWKYYTEIGFTDFTSSISGAKVVKAQHPEFEAWTAGVHAENGVSCADCHMSYTRDGAQKVSNHQVTSPMTDINGTCGTCHTSSEEVIQERVDTIQSRFIESRDRTLDSVTTLINMIKEAKDSGSATEEQIAKAQEYQNFASYYVDYAYSENSFGFHAPDYFQRMLSQSLDASRKGQLVLLGVSDDKLAPSDVAAANTTKLEEAGLN